MESNKIKQLETICAPATANGTSAIGIIRVTGEKAIEIVREVFRTFKGKKTELYFSIKPKVKIGYIIDSNKNIIDEVVYRREFSRDSTPWFNIYSTRNYKNTY